MKTVDLIYFNAGGGHRTSALALAAAVRQQAWPWQVRLVNLFEILDPEAKFRKVTGSNPEDWYNQRLARGWTLGMTQELKLLQGLVRLAHPALVRLLQQHWLTTEPDLVVSMVPNFNSALYESLVTALPGVPYVTVLTDLADFPPNFWIEPGQEQHFVCGTPKAVEQAIAQGHAAERVHATSGMIIRPEFYQPLAIDRDRERRRLGLDPTRPVGLVLFGGHGSRVMLNIARLLSDTQLIMICGHNKALASRLRAPATGATRVVVEFTAEIPYYMRLADFFIGKPGPGSISEAVHMGLPVIVVSNAWTMPQERYNAEWILDNRIGIVQSGYRRIGRAVDRMLVDLDEFRAAVDRLDNRALHEIPLLLAGILEDADAMSDGASWTRRAAESVLASN